MNNKGYRETVYIYNSHNIELENSTFAQNTTTATSGGNVNFGGAGIMVSRGNVVATNCTFTENKVLSSGSYGGGMYLRDCSAVLTDCIFTKNELHGENGGGLSILYTNEKVNYSYVNANIEIYGCKFEQNISQSYGGGLLIYSNGSIDNSYPISVKIAASATNKTEFLNNTAYSSGGALYLNSVALQNIDINISEANFFENKAVYSSSQGGAIFSRLWEGSNLTIDRCKFNENVSSSYGSAIFIGGEKYNIEVLNSEILNNKTNINGYGAVYSSANLSNILFDNCLYGFNSVEYLIHPKRKTT